LAGVSDADLETHEYPTQSIIYVTTGSPVPKHYDTVVPVEETILQENGNIEINEIEGYKQGQWIRPVGSDVSEGQTVLKSGMLIGPAEVGILASLGFVSNIQVYKKPTIGLLSTGSELVDAEETCLTKGNGKIRDSNSHMIRSTLKTYSFYDIKSFGIITDDEELVHERFQAMTSECQIIITSGGVSMGEKDLIKPYLDNNGEILFGRLNMKPGKPTTLARLNNSLVFSLPGNPVSCFVTAHLFIARALKLMSGFEHYIPPTIKVTLTQELRLDKIRPEYQRVVIISVNAKMYAISTGN
jgi:gephyrin